MAEHDLTKKMVFLTAWLSFLFAEILGLMWNTEFFIALERALWFALVMAILGWIASMVWVKTLRDINYFNNDEEEESSSITGVDYVLPEDLPAEDFEAAEQTMPDIAGQGGITVENFEEEIKKMAEENSDEIVNAIKTELTE